jgi:hypothetical protein
VSREWTRVARALPSRSFRSTLALTPLYPELYLVQIGVQADLQVDEAHEFRKHGGIGPEVPKDQVDLVDLEFRDVEQHGVLTG